jgi:hypothetical protein
VKGYYDAGKADRYYLFERQLCEHALPAEDNIECDDGEEQSVPDQQTFVERDKFT